jgi:hypothetical protein
MEQSYDNGKRRSCQETKFCIIMMLICVNSQTDNIILSNFSIKDDML